MLSRLTAGLLLLGGTLPAQTQKVEDLVAGKVLVMERDAPDPNFAQSVILLIHYDTDGVVGLMLNRAADVPLSRLRELEGTRQRADPAYVGGPVEVGVVTALLRASNAPPEAMHVAADIYAVQSRKGLEAALKNSKGPADLRVYLGYCGWIIPQLKNEVKLGSWHIFEHGERFAFDAEPATLWKRLIGRTGGTLASAPLRFIRFH
jgi:putative transcriptional regulator